MSEEKPLNNITPSSILDEIARRHEQANNREAVRQEKLEDYKKAINRLFSSPDGQFFLNEYLNYAGLTTFDKTLNPAKLVEDRGRQSIWFEMLRPYLHKSIRSQLDF